MFISLGVCIITIVGVYIGWIEDLTCPSGVATGLDRSSPSA